MSSYCAPLGILQAGFQLSPFWLRQSCLDISLHWGFCKLSHFLIQDNIHRGHRRLNKPTSPRTFQAKIPLLFHFVHFAEGVGWEAL
jgi:hypothetical protein